MDRDNAVREILQSIGPLFPEDAEKARAARKEALLRSEPSTVATAAAAAQAEPVRMTVAPKPMLASQVDNPATEKTGVATLAAVLERLAPPPPATSVREAIPGLVRPLIPEVSALRAALSQREQPAKTATPAAVAPAAVARAPIFTELPKEPVVEAAAVEPVEPAAVEVAPEPVRAEPAAKTAAAETPAAVEPVAEKPAEALPKASNVTTASDFSEDEHDAFVAAVAEALLTSETALPDIPVESRAIEPEVVDPIVVAAQAPITFGRPAAPAEPVTEKPKFKRAKARKDDKASVKPAVVAAPKAEEPKPTVEPEVVETAAAPATEAVAEPPSQDVAEVELAARDDDELIRQIRTHRADMIDVDEQLARLDQEIAAQKQEMARTLALVEQKNAHRARLVRLRVSTQRFVDTLQVRAEPVKRAPKQKKSA